MTPAQLTVMAVTTEQRMYARLAGIMMLVKSVFETFGDYTTIIARSGNTFAQTAQFVVEHPVLWRTSLLAVGVAWILGVIIAYAIFVVLEPVDKRLAQLALLLRIGVPFVGGASMMFRVALARVQSASSSTTFSPEQLGQLASIAQNGANAGVYLAWILLGLGSLIFFVLFLRSRYLPRALAWLGIVSSVLLIAVPAASFVFPAYQGTLKALLLVSLLADLATALWLLVKGLR